MQSEMKQHGIDKENMDNFRATIKQAAEEAGFSQEDFTAAILLLTGEVMADTGADKILFGASHLKEFFVIIRGTDALKAAVELEAEDSDTLKVVH